MLLFNVWRKLISFKPFEFEHFLIIIIFFLSLSLKIHGLGTQYFFWNLFSSGVEMIFDCHQTINNSDKIYCSPFEMLKRNYIITGVIFWSHFFIVYGLCRLACFMALIHSTFRSNLHRSIIFGSVVNKFGCPFFSVV